MSITPIVTRVDENILKVSYLPLHAEPPKGSLIQIVEQDLPLQDLCSVTDGVHFYKNEQKYLSQGMVQFTEQEIFLTKPDADAPMKKKLTANGWVHYNDQVTEISAGTSYAINVSFQTYGKQILTGLGQYEDGIYDYSGKQEYLYQSNMRNAFPVMISSEGYAIFIDTESSMIFSAEGDTITFAIEAGQALTYYVLFADSTDGLVAKLRDLTGRATMLPRFAFGYVQSKERYHSADELIAIKDTFKAKNIPLDCLVQDWYTWEEGKWGQKTTDKSRYPNLAATLENLHADNVSLIWSIWPNMSETAENYAEFKEADLLMGASPTYDSFSEAGRALYGEQCTRELLSAGLDGWWCDNAEPYSDADWNGEVRRPERTRYDLIVTEASKHIHKERINAYCLYHAKGIYDTWRKSGSKKRVMNLTRAVYPGAQQYGTILWSGDICARWDVMKNQIAEGLKTSLCGFPYWTLDIGAFFTVKDKYENRGCNSNGKNSRVLWFWSGDFNDGVQDLGYCELYTRWLQYGAFLPIFRSHGTDTPREPWQFGGKALPFEEVITKYIRLRYTLMPYIYSLAGQVHRDHATMMRSLMYDFSHDAKAIAKSDVFMMGKEFLVCPITKPMYYGPNSEKLPESDYNVSVYLPQGATWYDYWSNRLYQGGQGYDYAAPLETMPLFVKAGAIIPTAQGLSYAGEKGGTIDCIDIYTGADGSFAVYNDAGDGYGFEAGEYCKFTITYQDATGAVTFSAVEGSYPVQQQPIALRFITDGATSAPITVQYDGTEMQVTH
ncbi:MAG: glycoside hydrolase family 31 protein [Faecalibacterium sp.]